MFTHPAVGALAIASGLAVGAVSPAFADDPSLGIELMQPGFASFSTTGTADPLIVSKSFGTFSTNVEINNLVTNPLSIDLGSLNVSSIAAGNLTIIASATGLTSPIGTMPFNTFFSGNFIGDVDLVSLQTYISNSNTMFGTDTLLSSLSATSGPFSGSTSAMATTSAPFAITEVLNVRTSGFGVLSLDASATVAPEIDARSGGAAIALLLGVLALMSERRRRSATAIA